MAMRMASSLSASSMACGLLVLARSTSCPFCSIGVMTMKMISSTSITSTMGVTLMSLFTFLPSSRLFNAMLRLLGYALCPARASAALEEVVDQFARAVIHLHVKRLHLAGEVVEHH